MNAAANAIEKQMQDPPHEVTAEIANPSLSKEGADPSGEKMKVRRSFFLRVTCRSCPATGVATRAGSGSFSLLRAEARIGAFFEVVEPPSQCACRRRPMHPHRASPQAVRRLGLRR